MECDLLTSGDRNRPIAKTPLEETRSDVVVHGIHVALCSKIGERETNEDAHVIADLNELAQEAARGKTLPAPGLLVGVFDGHAGHQASYFAAQELPFQLVLNRQFPDAPEMGLQRSYEYTHRRFAAFAEDYSDSGTTALTLLALGSDIYVANAGDSRAVLVHTNGDGTELSRDHSPTDPQEAARIEAAGGQITVEDGVSRVNGVLSVTRGIGDLRLRPYIIEQPEIRHLAPGRTDACIVMACDGLWSVIESSDLAAEAAAAAKRGETPLRFAENMCDEAIAAGCFDNVTVAVISLPGGWEALAEGRPRDGPTGAFSDASGPPVEEKAEQPTHPADKICTIA